tara:strand:+ start:58100 stop:58564 length:465 start_codon:yes stop_codon:yes gene_type:complete
MNIDTTNLEKTIREFGNLLVELNKGKNIVLGGSNALMLHGIRLDRIPEDVDIILYKPTEAQMGYLESIKDFNMLQESIDLYNETPTVFKFKKYNLTLDILIEDKPMPDNLLKFKKGYINIGVQNISNVISAKSRYSRTKDLKDLLMLKNINFNI